MLYLRIIFSAVFVLCFSCSFSQKPVTVVFDEMCNYGGTRIVPAADAKAKRVSCKRSGWVVVDDAGCAGMPDSLKVALDIAADVWSGYLCDEDILNVKVIYEEMDGVDIRTSVSYYAMQSFYYPMCLYRKLTGITGDAPDAVIHINSGVDWCVGVGEGVSGNSKSLSSGMLRAFATAMGFGSSVKLDRRKENVVFAFANGMSVFDKLIFAEDGTRMESLNNNKREEFRSFVQQVNGNLYVSDKTPSCVLYAPPQFDENRSLKYMTDQSSLMYYKDEGVKDLVIDDVTIKILSDIGWDFSKESDVEIVGEGLDDTGIASAYQSHRFYIESGGRPVTAHSWKYQLPLREGGYEVVATSNSEDFIIPAISDEDKYDHTVEGDIRGLITFHGISGNSEISASYSLTLELKPYILSAEIVSIIPNANDNTYYDVEVGVEYAGSHELYATLTEEFNPNFRVHYSHTPYYARIRIPAVDSWGYALVEIAARNAYGNDNIVLEIPAGGVSKILGTAEAALVVTDGFSHIDVYGVDGVRLGTVKDFGGLKKYNKGFLILKIFRDDVLIKTMKYKCHEG